jgi:hypothetical protein
MKNKVILFVSLCAICFYAWKVQASNRETSPLCSNTRSDGIIIYTI